jgi:anti-sigma factor (TIGR02949 family)
VTDCGCEKARKALEEYLHNELCTEEATDIRDHMANCVDCADEHHVGLVLTDVIARSCAETAPEDLRSRVMSQLRDIQAHS